MTNRKVRLDVLVQERAGVSRAKAQGLIRAGQVKDPNGRRLEKPGERIAKDAEFVIDEGPRYVSRGGQKLEAALDAFELDVTNSVTLDAGASTGGFTDCLLQHGARKVYSVDVGYGQLNWTLRNDPRVVTMERTNVRHMNPQELDERPDCFVVDCSFISLALVLPAIARIVAPEAEGIALIKPQFEAGREDVGKGGVVRDPQVHERVLDQVRQAADTIGFETVAVIPSPLLGPAGNREFLAHLRLRPNGEPA